MRVKVIEHRKYIVERGEDVPEIEDRTWPYQEAQDAGGTSARATARKDRSGEDDFRARRGAQGRTRALGEGRVVYLAL
jgi:hypothetical protein